jgi:hypothetical protein
MDCEEIIYTGYAVTRMFERSIQTSDIRHVIESGEIISDYPNDIALHLAVYLGWARTRPLHVVVAFDEENKRCYVITCYIPEQSQWESDFKSRRKL